MGRKRKQGFSYFPLDIDFFSDIRIRKLIKNNGSQAVSIYLCVLTFIYENGYYVVNDRDLGFVISERTGCRESMVSAVLSYCVSIGLFDETMYKQGVFTSKSVQERYFLMCKSAKRTIVFSEYSLISSEEMRISSEEIAINSEKSTQSKVKNNYIHNYSDNINIIGQNEFFKISSEEIHLISEEKKEKISPPQPPLKKSQGDRQEKKFAPPSVEEIRAYCLQRQNAVDAETFFNFYQSKGWMVGKNKMKDWQAAVRTWEKNQKERQNEPMNQLANEPISKSTNSEPRIGRTPISEISRGLTGWE